MVDTTVKNLERIVRLALDASQDIRAQPGEHVVEVAAKAGQVGERPSPGDVDQRSLSKHQGRPVQATSNHSIRRDRHQQMTTAGMVGRDGQRSGRGRHRSVGDPEPVWCRRSGSVQRLPEIEDDRPQ
jgi:hypothetical protein